MANLLVDNTNDIQLDGRSFKRGIGVEYISRLVSQRLNTLLGEWEVDTAIGLPWLTTMLDKGVPRSFVDQAIRSTIETTFGVNSITAFSSNYDSSIRKLTYTFEANTIYGLLQGGN